MDIGASPMGEIFLPVLMDKKEGLNEATKYVF